MILLYMWQQHINKFVPHIQHIGHTCKLVHTQNQGNYVSIDASYQLAATLVNIHFVPQQICLPHCTCMSCVCLLYTAYRLSITSHIS